MINQSDKQLLSNNKINDLQQLRNAGKDLNH